MKKLIFLSLLCFAMGLAAQGTDVNAILKAIDANMSSGTAIMSSKMIVHGRRSSRTVASTSYSKGSDNFFVEYTDPPRERGTKMLKQGSNLWIYEPSTDRTIQISGNMLKQSVMGSDLSYEDFMEENLLSSMYNASLEGEITFDGRACYILKLTAKDDKVSYPSRLMYVDKQRNLPLFEQLFAKSGKLLKTNTLSDVKQIGKRWYPMKIVYKDELKDGKGTEFIIEKIEFDVPIRDQVFSRSNLRK